MKNLFKKLYINLLAFFSKKPDSFQRPIFEKNNYIAFYEKEKYNPNAKYALDSTLDDYISLHHRNMPLDLVLQATIVYCITTNEFVKSRLPVTMLPILKSQLQNHKVTIEQEDSSSAWIDELQTAFSNSGEYELPSYVNNMFTRLHRRHLASVEMHLKRVQ